VLLTIIAREPGAVSRALKFAPINHPTSRSTVTLFTMANTARRLQPRVAEALVIAPPEAWRRTSLDVAFAALVAQPATGSITLLH